MFDIKIQTSVSLSSGAIIELTPEQDKKIKDFTLDVVFGKATPKPDSVLMGGALKTTRKRAPKLWSLEEKLTLVNEVLKPFPIGISAYKLPRRNKIKELMRGPLRAHSYKNIYSMFNYLSHNPEKRPGGWAPVKIHIK